MEDLWRMIGFMLMVAFIQWQARIAARDVLRSELAKRDKQDKQ